MTLSLALVAMPWPSFDIPSAALGALSAYIRATEPRIKVKCYHEYLEVFSKITKERYEKFSSLQLVGELFYVAHLYKIEDNISSDAIYAYVNDIRLAREKRFGRKFEDMQTTKEEVLEVLRVTRENLHAAAEKYSRCCDILGLTTSFSQLFASLCLAKLVKENNPETKIVLGGIGANDCGSDLLNEFDFVDYMIEGEGELPLLSLLRSLLGDDMSEIEQAGIIASNKKDFVEECSKSDLKKRIISNLDTLPPPDYDDYAQSAAKKNIFWVIPIESARGCWWNKKAKTNNPWDACFFCGLNRRNLWRTKSTSKIALEMKMLAERHENVRFRFVDNALCKRGGSSLRKELRKDQKHYWFFCELRASVTSRELLDLLDAGCNSVQIGIEGLSTDYLKRMNKGTTTIQNLAAMRTCFELGISCGSNLIVNFPGTTQQEIDEMTRTIIDYAVAFPPLNLSQFEVEVDSTVFCEPEYFGVENIRNHHMLVRMLPKEVAKRLTFTWLSHDSKDDSANWDTLFEAYRHWTSFQKELRPLFRETPKALFYQDGGSFLEIVDKRNEFRTITITSTMREIYLYCMEPKNIESICKKFERIASRETIMDEILTTFVDEKLMYEENGKYLSMAVAWRKEAAIERIRSENSTQSSQ